MADEGDCDTISGGNEHTWVGESFLDDEDERRAKERWIHPEMTE